MKTFIIGLIGSIFFSLSHASALDSILLAPATPDNAPVQRLHHEFRGALIDIGVNVKSRVFIESELGQPLNDASIIDILDMAKPYLAKSSDRLILVELGLMANNSPYPDPFLKAIDLKTGDIVAQSTTLPLLDSHPDSLAAAAAALARSLEKRLDLAGYQTNLSDVKPWGGKAHILRLAFEGFNGCEQEAAIQIIENEFPGVINIDLEKAPNHNYAIYQLNTTAQTQRIRKWIQRMMIETGMHLRTDYNIFVNNQTIRMKKPDAVKAFWFQCGS